VKSAFVIALPFISSVEDGASGYARPKPSTHSPSERGKGENRRAAAESAPPMPSRIIGKQPRSRCRRSVLVTPVQINNASIAAMHRRWRLGVSQRHQSMSATATAFAESGHRGPPDAGVIEQSASWRRPSTLLGLTENRSVAEIQHMAQQARSKPAGALEAAEAVGWPSRHKTHHGAPYAFLEAS
jgi:hypothetical protein